MELSPALLYLHYQAVDAMLRVRQLDGEAKAVRSTILDWRQELPALAEPVRASRRKIVCELERVRARLEASRASAREEALRRSERLAEAVWGMRLGRRYALDTPYFCGEAQVLELYPTLAVELPEGSPQLQYECLALADERVRLLTLDETSTVAAGRADTVIAAEHRFALRRLQRAA